MPSRAVTLGIIVFWLAAIGWLGYREWWHAPEQPPLLDRTDEVGTQTAVWRVHLNGEDVGSARLKIQREQKDRLFTLAAEYSAKGQFRFPGLAVERLTTSYRVTPRGELCGVEWAVSFGEKGDTWLRGRLGGGRFTGTLRRVGQESREAVEVEATGGLVNLLQPLHRLLGLHEGRQWRVTGFNPLAAAREDQSWGWPPCLLKAEASAEQVTWHDRDIACWRVEYRSGGVVRARLWARRDDAHVLRHEVQDGDTRITLEREPLQALPGRTFPGLGRGPK
jgi:hypothetical protein